MKRMRSVPCRAVCLALILAAGLWAWPARSAGEGPASGSLRERAVQEILAASRSGDVQLRANAMEAAALLPDRVPSLVRLGLEDANPVVRFAAAVIAGQQKLVDLVPALQKRLEDEHRLLEAARERLTEAHGAGRDTSSLVSDVEALVSVRGAILYAMRRCGRKVDVSDLSGMLASRSPGLRGNAATLLGLLGDRSAVPMLQEAAGRAMPRASAVQDRLVAVQLAEAVVRLGDDSALDPIRAAAYSDLPEVRVQAVDSLGQLGDRRMEPAMKQMLASKHEELKVIAARSLARLGDHEGLEVLLAGAGSEEPILRALAASSLGWFAEAKASAAVEKLLGDPVPQVRLAAATAVLRRETAR